MIYQIKFIFTHKDKAKEAHS